MEWSGIIPPWICMGVHTFLEVTRGKSGLRKYLPFGPLLPRICAYRKGGLGMVSKQFPSELLFGDPRDTLKEEDGEPSEDVCGEAGREDGGGPF
ncbi:unnamed protein product [Allacma fusca]|uniref:Uncharacterized protein n=1 Tax=Allacma fusca TaxID=39272 RepID=A0A8J2JJU3_9HEXA|nr:unnamed protein product [Allacma fusca]